MSVKFIFKALIGTIFVILISCILIELFNSFTTSYQLKAMSKVAARQACVLYAQETYKRSDTNLNLSDVGRVTSNFYNSSDAKTIYKNTTSDAKMTAYIGSIKDGSDTTKKISTIPWTSFNYWYNYLKTKDNNNIYGKLYYNNLVTPINMGVTYLDKEVVNKMYRWNLASMLKTKGSTSYIKKSGKKKTNTATAQIKYPEGRMCIEYKGFRVWFGSSYSTTTGTSISDIKYTMYNLSDTEQAKKFYNITSIGSEDGNTLKDLYDGSDERQYVVVADVPYQVEVSYKGITPLRHIINFVNNKRVAGYNGTDVAYGTSDIGDKGLYGSKSYLNLEGNVTYYIMR